MIEGLFEDIRNKFATIKEDSSLPLDLIETNDSFVIKTSGHIGVGFNVYYNEPFHEKFSRIDLEYVPNILIEGSPRGILYLYTEEIDNPKERSIVLNEFAKFCADFIDPGEYGYNRLNISRNPREWWEAIKTIIGNSSLDSAAYPIIAELAVYCYLLKNYPDKEFSWTGAKKSRVDFSGENMTIEVKASTVREKTNVTMHGQFQADEATTKTDSKLVFCRMEKIDTEDSFSINDLIFVLSKKYGVNKEILEKELKSLGIMKGSSLIKEKYKFLEIRLYNMDENFPRITADKFKNNQIPKGIIDINYTISLDNLDFFDIKDKTGLW